MKKYPEPIRIDGETIQVHSGCPTASVGRHLNLSPYEAEQLRDWLTEYLRVYYETENTVST